MKKYILFLATLLISVVSFGQQKRDLKLNKNTNLIDVTYYHDNGVISQTGAYTIDGKLQGEWLSFDKEGSKIALANYKSGKKVGKWFYWDKNNLKEVDYTSNAIASINEWTDKKAVAVSN